MTCLDHAVTWMTSVGAQASGKLSQVLLTVQNCKKQCFDKHSDHWYDFCQNSLLLARPLNSYESLGKVWNLPGPPSL